MYIIKKCEENKIYIALQINNIIIGDINSIIDENTCIIKYIIVKDEFRNKGYGTMLLQELIEYCKECKINKIELDDMSDNFRKDNNIYLKNNFQYIDEGYPEMVLYLFN